MLPALLLRSACSGVRAHVVAASFQPASLKQLTRSYSTGFEDAPTLKAVLRELFKRVHPDAWHEFPAQQFENERSFKLLQDYLAQARNGDPRSPTARLPYTFHFYLRPDNEGTPTPGPNPTTGASTETDAAATAAQQFRQVRVVLPPPEPGRQQGVLSPGALKGLSRLLQLCGLPAVAADEGTDAAEAARRLSVFLPGAAEMVQQAEAGAVRAEVVVANLRGAMRLGRQVVVGFERRDLAAGQQVRLLEALAGVLDLEELEHVELSGLHVLFGSRTALDPQGTLWLDASAPPDEWADFLTGVDLDFARGKRQAAAALRRLEAATAAATGLSMLFAPGPYLMTPQYRQFLERLAAHAASHGAIGGGASRPGGAGAGGSAAPSAPPFGELPLYVAPPQATSGQQQQQQQQQQQHAGEGGEIRPEGFAVNVDVGYLQVPMDAAAHQVYGHVLEHGQQALRSLQQRRLQAAEVDELTARARSQLRLRRLLRDDLVTVAQYKSGCLRLMQQRTALLEHLEGMSVRLSDANRLAADGSIVDIAWDFEM